MLPSFYGLYSGDGSETTYTDGASVSILQAEMIALSAAVDLTISAISYYKDDVVRASGGPASADFRTDKLAWLKEQLKELKDKLDLLESANGYGSADMIPGLLLKKVRACLDPADDVCCGDADLEAFEATLGVTS